MMVWELHGKIIHWSTRMACNGFTLVRTSSKLQSRSVGDPPLTMNLSSGGGMPQSRNRTKWPILGGTVAFQPGWFPGHLTALIYINFGLGEIPENMSHVSVPPFQITGPTNNPYPGTVCLPQVPLPSDINVTVGDKATIQLVEVAKHGAGLFDVC